MRRWYAQPVPWGIYVFTILLLGAAFGVGAAFAIQSAIDSHDAKTAATRQIEGRRVAVDVLCGFGNGVAQAGKNVIRGRRANGRRIPGVTFTKGEQKIRDAAAQDYGGFIVQTVQAQAGVRSRDVVKRDGTLSCKRLRDAARTSRP